MPRYSTFQYQNPYQNRYQQPRQYQQGQGQSTPPIGTLMRMSNMGNGSAPSTGAGANPAASTGAGAGTSGGMGPAGYAGALLAMIYAANAASEAAGNKPSYPHDDARMLSQGRLTDFWSKEKDEEPLSLPWLEKKYRTETYVQHLPDWLQRLHSPIESTVRKVGKLFNI